MNMHMKNDIPSLGTHGFQRKSDMHIIICEFILGTFQFDNPNLALFPRRGTVLVY